MPKEKTVIKDTQPLTDIKDTPSDNGAHPEIVQAIKVAELLTDLNDLQSQALAISGAVQYIQQKIAQLKGEALKPVDTF